MIDELGDITLERTFESHDSSGKLGTVTLRIGIPYLFTESKTERKWRCPYQIIGIGPEKIKIAPGMDAIDALQLCLLFAETFLKEYARLDHVNLTWLGEEWLGLSPVEIPDLDDSNFESDDSTFREVFEEFFRNFGKKSSDSPS